MGCVATGAVVVATGIAAAVRDVRPEVALQMQPFDAVAHQRVAEQLLIASSSTPAQRRDGEALARTALARDAVLPAAWRTLAMARALRDDRRASTLLAIAERLSRRDVATQLAIIEEQVQRGDVAGALVHYDIALRVAPSADPLLLPILVLAAGDANVRPALARLLVHAPAWRRRFFSTMENTAPPSLAYEPLLAEMRRYGALPEIDIHRGAVARLAESGQTGSAWHIAALLDGGARWAPLVRNGRFLRADDTPPLDWSLDQGGNVEGVENGAGGAGRLTISSSNGDAGRAAHQLLRLAPGGAYRLAMTVGPVAGADPAPLYAVIHCSPVANPDNFARLEVNPTRPTRAAMSFRTPTDCGAAWLELGARLGRSDTAGSSWVTDVSIVPLH